MSFFKKLERKILRPIGRAIKKAVSWVTGLQDFDVNDMNQGALVNKQSNVEPIPVIYGERKVGGTRVFVATSGSDNTYLYVVLALCEGEINQIGDVYINEIISSDARFSGKVTITKYVGTDAQTADATLVAASVGWTSNHRLRGIAYLAMRFTYDQDTFGGGIPEVTCVVQGKKCYDPRTSTTIYTKNPAVCLRDYLINTRYGKGLSSALIDDAAFIIAADKCDAAVSKYTGASGTEPIFNVNTIINTGETLFNNVKVFLASMRGIFPFSDGKYSLVIEDDYAATFAFSLENIKSDITVTSLPKSQQYNRVTAKFTNPQSNWQLDSVTWPLAGSTEYTDYLADDNSIELVGEINIPGTTDYYSARDLARIVCLDSRLAKLTVEFVSTTDALKCAIGDVVTLTHESMGWVDKEFRVTDLVLLDSGEVSVGLKEHIAAIYPWVEDVAGPASASSTLPNPLDVEPPTSLTITETTYVENDGTIIPEVLASWTAANDKFVESYELQFKLSADSVYQSIITIEPRFLATNLQVGDTYNIRVRSINGIGIRSDWATSTYTILGDTTGPATPTGLTIVGSYNEAVAKWTACADKDYKETILYASLTNDFATATEQVRVSGTTVTYYNLPLNTTYYAWLKHVDFSGNLSTVSAAVTFTTTTGITTSQLADGSVTEVKIGSSAVTAGKIGTNAVTSAKINSSAVTEAKIATGAVTVNKIGAGAVTNAKLDASAVAANVFAAGVQPITIVTSVPGTKSTDAIFNTTDGKLYRWNGSAYVKSVENDDIVSMVADKITAGTINAAITTTNVLQLSTAGKIYTAGKTSAASTTAGVFLGHDGASSYDFAVGDATRSIVYDGSAGSFTITNVDIVSTGYMYAQGGYNDGTYTGAIYAQPTNSSQRGVIGRSTGSGVGTTGRTNTGVGLQGIADSASGVAVQAFAGSASGVAIEAAVGNLMVGAATNTGQGNVIIKNGVAGSRLGDQIIILSEDSGDAQATLHLIVEEDVVAGTGPLASTGIDQIKIRINGVEYWLPVVAV